MEWMLKSLFVYKIIPGVAVYWIIQALCDGGPLWEIDWLIDNSFC